MKISIVIPVYNEAAHLPACLAAIARQTVRPSEVIVVDNNSSDATAAIAQSYDFVRLLREPRQGVVYARDRGFDAAHGDIIGRIDADTVVSDNWVETLQAVFADESIGAVTGAARYYDMALAPLLNRIDLSIRRYLAFVLGRHVALQGANMALRRQVWQSARPTLCRVGGMHEDFDLSIHINQQGHRAVFNASLIVSLGARQMESSFRGFAEYVMLSPRTYALHGLKRHRHMYPVVWLAILFYVPLKVLHRGYDATSDSFSWAQLLQQPNTARVNPATYVD